VLAAETSSFRLILFGLLFLGWIVKTIAENRKKRRQAEERRRGHPAPHETGEHEPVERLPPVQRRQREVLPPEPAARAEVAPTPVLDAGPTPLGTISRDDVADAAARRAGRTRETLLRRLGAAEARRPTDVLRTGILWSEILGPPRGLTGRHHSPAARRALAIRGRRGA
jgi:hypothetical protein